MPLALLSLLLADPVLTRPPTVTELVEAEYPAAVLAEGKGGEVVFILDVAADGKVGAVELVSATDERLIEPARAALLRFRFSPAEVDGVPAAVRLEYRYVFTPPPPPPPPEPAAAVLLAPISLRLTVLEAGARQPVAGAGVRVDGEVVAETDAAGVALLRGLAPGRHLVVVESPQFEREEHEEEVAAGSLLEATYYLLRRGRDPYETIVRSEKDRRHVARVDLSRQEVEKVPGTFGDPVRVLENLPGMGRAEGGLGGQLIVRGAHPNDTAIYIDGIDVPLVFHASGLVSVINAELLESVDFYPGGFGARYGRATGGVVDVKTRALSCDQVRGVVEIDVMDAGAYTCVPLGAWRLAVAARRSYLDAVLPVVMDGVEAEDGQGAFYVSPYYWDYQAKAERQAGRHRFTIFAFGTHDSIRVGQEATQEGVDWSFSGGLSAHKLLLQHRFAAPGLTLTSTLVPGVLLQRTHVGSTTVERDQRGDIDVASLNWREDLSLDLIDGVTLNAGIDLHTRVATLLFDTTFSTEVRPFPAPVNDSLSSQSFEGDVSEWHHAYWAEVVLEPAPGLRLVPGIRVDRFDFHRLQRVAVQPRLAARFSPWEETTFKAAFGVYEKVPSPELVVDGFGNPYLDAERAQHWVVGVEQALPAGFEADVQGFVTQRERLPVVSQRLVVRDGAAVPELYDSSGTGRTVGAELLLRKRPGPDSDVHGWVAYTLSRSTLTDRSADATAAASAGDEDPTLDAAVGTSPRRTYLSPFDQTHLFTAVVQTRLPWGFEIGGRFSLTSGVPYTPLERGRTYYDADLGAYRVVPGSVRSGSARKPTLHRLDVRLDRTFTFDLWKLTAYLEVLNAYYAKSPEFLVYDYRYRESAMLSGLPIVPALGVKGEF